MASTLLRNGCIIRCHSPEVNQVFTLKKFNFVTANSYYISHAEFPKYFLTSFISHCHWRCWRLRVTGYGDRRCGPLQQPAPPTDYTCCSWAFNEFSVTQLVQRFPACLTAEGSLTFSETYPEADQSSLHSSRLSCVYVIQFIIFAPSGFLIPGLPNKMFNN
jgi:hypothetical protein